MPDDIAADAGDQAATVAPPRRSKGGRVLLFFIYFFGFAVGLPALAIAVVQANYGLIDGPPSIPANAFGEQIKSIAKYGVFIWAGAQAFLFGRIASWAGGEPAVRGVRPVEKETLMSQLLALNQQDIPFTVKRGRRDNEIIIDWRYADAKWLDLMRLHGMRSSYRLVIRLDKRAHNARAQDQYAAFDGSTGAGPSLAAFNWQASLGITFYEYKHERVFGLQFKDGKPIFDLSYAYTFDLNELKQPVIAIIRNAGWNFRPVITFFRPIGG